jgi:hypothetical protein
LIKLYKKSGRACKTVREAVKLILSLIFEMTEKQIFSDKYVQHWGFSG